MCADTPAARAKREHRFAASFRPAQDTRDAAVPADGIMALEHAVERRKLNKQQKVRQGLERLNRFHRQYVVRLQRAPLFTMHALLVFSKRPCGLLVFSRVETCPSSCRTS